MMRAESAAEALLVVMSAMFDTLPAKRRKKVAAAIELASHRLVDDPDARRLLSTFDFRPSMADR
jgi:hypothetical protein